MSLKLPFIIKKEIPPNSPNKQKDANSPPPRSPSPQPEEDYQNNLDFQQIEQSGSPRAVQTFAILKSKPQIESEQFQVDVMVQRSDPTKQQEVQGYSIKDLEQQLSEKVKTVSILRTSIDNKKKQIKAIGDKIDKDLNKSLLKASKPNTTNIRDIFSATPKCNSQKIHDLNQELKKTRLTIKKVKAEIQRAQEGFSNPVSQLNQDRGIQYKTKINNTQAQIRLIEDEKSMIEQEIERGGRDFNEEEEKHRAEDLSKMTHQLYQIQNSQKDKKLQLYHLEKQDIFLMEKTKFFQERQGHIGTLKRPKISQKDKEKIEQQMRQLISEINSTIQERNKTEIDRKQQVKHLGNEAASLQTVNLDLCNKLRQFDAFLLQYYEKKTRRKEGKNLEKTIDVMEKSVSGNIQTHSIVNENFNKSKFSDKNDKNYQVKEVPLVQKKKNYEFGIKQQLQNEINLSDDFLGQKLVIKSIVIKCSKQKILCISAQYWGLNCDDARGLIMGAKNLPQDTQDIELKIGKQEVINFIHTGYTDSHAISFLHIVTSDGNELKWGSQDQLIKSEQKHVKKYQSSFLKSKFLNLEPTQSQDFIPFLAGFTLITTYMSPK